MTATTIPLLAVCPSVLVMSTGLPVAVCTQLLNRTPAVYLLEPQTGLPLAHLQLARGELLGDVYPYLDHQDRVVTVTGGDELVWVRAQQGVLWELRVERRISLREAVRARCGGSACGGVGGIIPDHAGRLWFVTNTGTVGVVHAGSERIETYALPPGEVIANSIASAPEGVAVVSDYALYLFDADERGRPRLRFRAPYDRGPARKPGQFVRGSGTTPTFFGPTTGSEYVTIVDNASPLAHLLVYRANGDGTPFCVQELPAPTGDGTEVSPIGAGRSVFVSSSYGYPYPASPVNAGPSVPAQAPIAGGMSRVDLAEDGSGCRVVWSNDVRSATVAKLSRADTWLYTIERELPLGASAPTPLDPYAYTVISAETGRVVARQRLAVGTDTLQLAGTLAPGRVLYQGFLGGILRIAPAPGDGSW